MYVYMYVYIYRYTLKRQYDEPSQLVDEPIVNGFSVFR